MAEIVIIGAGAMTGGVICHGFLNQGNMTLFLLIRIRKL